MFLVKVIAELKYNSLRENSARDIFGARNSKRDGGVSTVPITNSDGIRMDEMGSVCIMHRCDEF
jgi:hypothetical protein